MGAGWGAGVLDQHGELTRIRRRWLRFWLTALGSLIPRTLDFLWQSHPWGYRVGRGELFLASGGRKNFRKADTVPSRECIVGSTASFPKFICGSRHPPRAQNGGGLGEGSLQRGRRYNEVWKAALIA